MIQVYYCSAWRGNEWRIGYLLGVSVTSAIVSDWQTGEVVVAGHIVPYRNWDQAQMTYTGWPTYC